MKLSELMKGHNPSPTFEGFVTNDDFVLAVDCTADGSAASVGDYAVVQIGVSGLDAQLNPVTQDKQYIRAGQSTTKTGNQRSFAVSGDRYVGDDFQDFALSHAVKYCPRLCLFLLAERPGRKGQGLHHCQFRWLRRCRREQRD